MGLAAGRQLVAAALDPAVPDPVVPDPVAPDPAVPDPAVLDPAAPGPAVPDPVAPDPEVLDPAALDPAAQYAVAPLDPPTSDPPTSDPPTSDPPTSDPPTSDPPTSEASSASMLAVAALRTPSAVWETSRRREGRSASAMDAIGVLGRRSCDRGWGAEVRQGEGAGKGRGATSRVEGAVVVSGLCAVCGCTSVAQEVGCSGADDTGTGLAVTDHSGQYSH